MAKKAKILIIDDEEDFCFFLKFNFETIKKYKVFTATNGKDGIKTAIQKKPDLILLDIMMPLMNGFDVLNSLKKDTQTAAIPVVMLTAIDQDQSKKKAKKLYAHDYFPKTIDLVRLAAGIDEILSRQIHL